MSIKHIAKEYIKMGVQGLYLPAIYDRARRDPVDEKKIIFADAHNHTTPYSMRRLEEACRSAGYYVETHYSDYGRDGAGATVRAMKDFMKSFATAHAVVICDTFLPVASCDKRPETRVVQLWHGAGALKKFGYATEDDVPSYYRGNIYKNYDLITVSGKKAVEPFAASMRAEEGVTRAIGVSRTDNYFDSAYIKAVREKIYAALPELRDKKTVLFAPTFRGNADEASESGPKLTAARLREKLPSDWSLLVSAHPHARGEKSSFTSEELMLVADVLVTDYSSIIFDYLFLKRPVVLFAPDYEEYGMRRGFYTPYEKLPGRIVTDESVLSEAIVEEEASFDKERIDGYLEEYLEACDGHATERILEYLK